MALALVLTACSGGGNASPDGGANANGVEPVTGGNITVASLPAMIDPYVTTSRTNWMVAASVCEGLFANGANMDVQNGLAEDFTYGEATGEYLITVRDGVTLHSGGALTADDVVASLERYSAGDAGALFASLVSGIEAVDDLVVKITTESPTGAIPALLATPDTGAYIMSASSIAAAGDADLTTLDCTGPYVLDEFTVDRSATISRFDDYVSRDEEPDGAAGAKTAHADTITFNPLNEDNVVNQLRTGQVNVAPQFVSMDQLAVYESDQSLNPVVSPGSGFSLIQFNLQEGPFTDIELRKAVMNAVMPEEIALQQLGSDEYFEDISSMFPAESPWYSEAGSEIWDNRDPAEAARILEAAGYDGSAIRILYRPTSDNYGPLLEQQLEAVGFNVELLSVDAATFGATRTDSSEWDIFLAGGTAYSDPLTVVFLNDDFPGWWATDEKRTLVAELTAGANIDERKPVWDELQQQIWEYLPFIKLGHEPRLVVTSSDVGGLEPSQGTVRGYYNVWITE
ncbi:ABC transporter substrate-binding protein [Humidisolicoccus flavus]|uniref:ABC transporter substrate-binding protein n=1 Tax=Humidisolicoccus flavus TaxID=3111414 RepID=UPI00324D8A37